MTNWVRPYITEFLVTGQPEQVAEFRKKLMWSVSEDRCHNTYGKMYLGNVLVGFGYNCNAFCCGGSIIAISGTENDELRIVTNTMAIGCNEMFEAIVSQYNSLKLYWFGICDERYLVESNDKEHTKFSYSHMVYLRFNDQVNTWLIDKYDKYAMREYLNQCFVSLGGKEFPRFYDMSLENDKWYSEKSDNKLSVIKIVYR